MGSRRLVAIFSDTHAGSRLGLMPPDVVLWDEDEEGNPVAWTPKQSAVQEWLWRHYTADMDAAWMLADGDPLLLVHNGDLTQGRKYPTELVSTRESDQITIAVANIARWFDRRGIQAARLIHGTGSHGFNEATADQLVAAQLRAMHPGRDIVTVRHGLFTVDGVLIDCAHHGPSPGIRQWTNGNQLRYYATSLMNDELLRGRVPPRVVVRSHYHTYTRETVRVHGEHEWVTDIIVTPAYCGMNEYAAQATRSAYLISCGLVVIEIVDGALREVHALTRAVDLRREETL